ncbi:MAG: hypothetical protein K2P78_00960 [Gemmataceae bacterium]|nr:hypothetical protein [Gemmataceae bacterium]
MVKRYSLVFDGKTFVPTEPVELPVGTRADVVVTLDEGGGPTAMIQPPPPMTPERQRTWEELTRQWASGELPWATVDDAIGYSRGRPGYHLISDPENPAGDGP